jgi:hypothetical protein
LKGRGYLEGANGGNALKYISRYVGIRVWIGFAWLRIRTGDGFM